MRTAREFLKRDWNMVTLNEQSLKHIAYGDTFFSPMYGQTVRFNKWEDGTWCSVMTTDKCTALPDYVHKV